MEKPILNCPHPKGSRKNDYLRISSYFYPRGINYSRCLSGFHASFDEWVSVDICAIAIITLPSRNDLPVGHIMMEVNNEIRPNLILASEESCGAESGEIMNIKIEVRAKMEIQGNKR